MVLIAIDLIKTDTTIGNARIQEEARPYLGRR